MLVHVCNTINQEIKIRGLWLVASPAKIWDLLWKNKLKGKRDCGIAQAVEFLLIKWNAPSSIPSTAKKQSESVETLVLFLILKEMPSAFHIMWVWQWVCHVKCLSCWILILLNSKWDKKLNVSPESLKLLEEITGKTIPTYSHRQQFPE
jgi:hypothetical protein